MTVFMMPLGPNLGYDRHPRFLLNKKGPAMTNLVNLMLTPMSDSVTMNIGAHDKTMKKLSKKQKKGKQDTASVAQALSGALSNAPAPMATKLKTGESDEKPTDVDAKGSEITAGDDGDADDQREKLWIDDLWSVVQGVHAELAAKGMTIPAADVGRVKNVSYSIALEFALSGSLALGSVVYKQWSTLRVELAELARACHTRGSAQAALAAAGGGQSDVAPDLLCALSRANAVDAADASGSQAAVATQPKKQDPVEVATELATVVGNDLLMFKKNNPASRPAKMHPTYKVLLETVWTDIEQVIASQNALALSRPDVFKFIFKHLSGHLPGKWMDLGLRVGALLMGTSSQNRF
jgi:hypothetical protein